MSSLFISLTSLWHPNSSWSSAPLMPIYEIRLAFRFTIFEYVQAVHGVSFLQVGFRIGSHNPAALLEAGN